MDKWIVRRVAPGNWVGVIEDRGCIADAVYGDTWDEVMAEIGGER